MTHTIADKREAILQAAIELFTKNGFHGTPTSKIAQTAGVATGTLFHYFKTKEELINKLYFEIKEELTHVMSAGLEKEKTVRGKMRKIWLNAMSWNIDNPSKFNFFQQFRESPYISNLTREEATAQFNYFYDIIEDGRRQDILKDISTELILEITSGIFHGAAVYFYNNPDKLENKEHMEMAFNLYWDSVKR